MQTRYNFLLLFTQTPKKGTNTGNRSRFCLPNRPKRKQTRAIVPAFVYQNTKKGNKHGQVFPLLFPI